MQAGIVRYGRTVLATLTAAALMLSLVALLANPAAANHIPPDDQVANDGPAGTNEAPYWETYLANVRGITDATCSKINQASDDAWVMPAEPAGQDWVLLVVKQADTNYVFYDPIAGHAYPSVGNNAPGYSHIIVCSADEPEETTTTTEEETTTTVEETTTTVEETTTTVEETTTTTQPTTSTSQATTTSSTIPDQVLALVLVTVEGTCIEDDGEGEGEIEVGMSIDDAATVVIRNSSGSVVGTVTRDAVLTVPEGATYSWAATPSEGFEFASDFDADGTVTIASCSDLEVLPFTGVESENLAVIASVLSALGLLVLLATRKVED